MGNLFLVIWMTSREENKWYLEGKRIGPNGIPADLIDIQIEKDRTNKIFPAILWDGDQYVLIWEEEPEGESKICGASILPQFKPFEDKRDSANILPGCQRFLLFWNFKHKR